MSDTPSPLPLAPSPPNRSDESNTYPNGRRAPIGSQGEVATRQMDFIPDGPSKPPVSNPGMPERLGPYRLIKPLGHGGMGAVYLAEDTQLRRPTALKVMLPSVALDRQARERFLREARAAAAIRNDHVVTVYQVGEENGTPFIAMEVLRGAPLDAFLAKEPAPTITAVIRLAREIATGLAAAHDKGLVHRDIKPANVWLEAPKGRVKILDFGLARPAKPDREDVDRLTCDGMVMGTPSYMSPEQARGEAVDFRTDLFSLGTVLYRLCTGQLPFSGPTTTAVLTQLAIADPPSAAERNPQVPAALSALIDRLLKKEPAERPKSARAVADELRQMDLTPSRPTAATMVRPTPPPQADDETEEDSQPTRPCRRRRRRKQRASTDWLMGVVAVLVLGAMAIGVPLAIYKAIPERKTAESKPADVVPTPAAANPAPTQSLSRPVEQPRSNPGTRPDPPPPPEPPRRPGEEPPRGFPPPPPPGRPFPGGPGGPPPGAGGFRPGP
jgi:serine/threonine protein kinase